ncbi:MAG TPA: Ig-like domain-containing protein, partial [Albitalea sp.]
MIADLENNEPTAATAAIGAGDGGAGMEPGLRVGRVNESVPGGPGLIAAAEPIVATAFTPGNQLTGGSAEQNEPSPGDGGETPTEEPAPAVNAVPVASATAVTGLEDSTLPIALGGSDADGAVVGVTIVSVPMAGTLMLADGVTVVSAGQTLTPAQAATLLFQPAADFNGNDGVTFTVTDNAGAVSAPASISILVTAVNDAPVASVDVAVALEDTPLAGNVLDNDSDVDDASIAVSSFAVDGTSHPAGAMATLPGIGDLTLNADGSYLFTPAADYNGPVPVITYTVTDGALSATSSLTLSVSAVNDAPVATHDLASTAINTALTIAVLANDLDVDGDSLSVTGAELANPAHGTVAVNLDGTLTFTPAADFSGSAVVAYSITDGHGGNANASVTINVGSNTPPEGSDAALSIAEDTSHTFGAADFGFSDADAGQTLSAVRIDALPAAGALTLGGVAVTPGQVV